MFNKCVISYELGGRQRFTVRKTHWFFGYQYLHFFPKTSRRERDEYLWSYNKPDWYGFNSEEEAIEHYHKSKLPTKQPHIVRKL